MKKKTMIILMISTICLSSSLVSNVNKASAPSGNYNISFGEMIYYESSDSLLEYIRWSFECSNGVNIMVYMATADDFSSWNDASFYLLSSGSTSNSGKFNIPREDSWVIFFMHSDLLHPLRTASVYIDVHFSLLDLVDDYVNWDQVWEIVILIVKIAGPIIVGLILLRIIVGILRSFKQKEKVAQTGVIQSEMFSITEESRKPEVAEIIKEQEVQEDNTTEEVKYCTKCGTQASSLKEFCRECGKEFKKRNEV